ncbi:caspase-8-like [Glandiceps talaboti]
MASIDPLCILFLRLNGEFGEDDEYKIRQYLSGDHISKREIEQLRDVTAILLKLVELGKISKDNLSFLKEMFTTIKRTPLVKVVDDYEKENNGQTSMSTEKKISPLKKLFDDLSGKLSSQDEQTIRNLLAGQQISRRDMEKLRDPVDIFMKLEEHGYIAANDLLFLKEIFIKMRRPPLVQNVEKYEKGRDNS